MRGAAVLAFLAAACPGAGRGGPDAPGPGGRIADAAAAAARYRSFHQASIAPALSEAKRRRAAALLARDPGTRHLPCRGATRGIADSAAPRPLHGSLGALDRDGDCWVLRWDGRRSPGLGAAVGDDGAVLLAWWIPEG